MLNEICAYLKNWFDTEKYFDTFVVADGNISGMEDRLQNGQYFRIVGSVFNDGIYQYPATGLKPEKPFDGAVWALAIPEELIALEKDIAAWCEKYGSADSQAMSPFSSESFGGYSYSKSSGGSAADGSGAVSWKSVYASELARWRKL